MDGRTITPRPDSVLAGNYFLSRPDMFPESRALSDRTVYEIIEGTGVEHTEEDEADEVHVHLASGESYARKEPLSPREKDELVALGIVNGTEAVLDFLINNGQQSH